MKLNIEKIENHHPDIIGMNHIFQSAVCIPLIPVSNGYDILFEVRSSKLEDQPGDICFPGGAIEKGESAQKAAVRELCEELLIDREQWVTIGSNDYLQNDHLVIYPFIGILNDYNNTYNEEVEKVFRVPLEYLVNYIPEEYEMNFKPDLDSPFPFDRIQGGKNYKWRNRTNKQYFYQYQEYCIWGLTARILHNFIENFIEKQGE